MLYMYEHEMIGIKSMEFRRSVFPHFQVLGPDQNIVIGKYQVGIHIKP